MNREQMEKSKELIPIIILQLDTLSEQIGTIRTDDWKQTLQTALTALDALISAGECFAPVHPRPGGIIPVDDPHNEGETRGYLRGYNTRADEDTAILGKKLAGLEEVIRQVPLFKDGIGQDEGCNVGVEINEESVNKLAQAIAQHLKGEGR